MHHPGREMATTKYTSQCMKIKIGSALLKYGDHYVKKRTSNKDSIKNIALERSVA